MCICYSYSVPHVCRDNIGNITFKEAYQRTGKIINITVCSMGNHERPRLLNYLTAPNVLIWYPPPFLAPSYTYIYIYIYICIFPDSFLPPFPRLRPLQYVSSNRAVRCFHSYFKFSSVSLSRTLRFFSPRSGPLHVRRVP